MNASVGYFIGGIVVGSIAGSITAWFVTKNRYEKKLDNKIKEMSDEIAKVDPFAPTKRKSKSGRSDADMTQKNKKEEKVNTVSYDDVVSTIKAAKKESESRVDYTKAYDTSNDEVSENQETFFDLMKDAEEVADDDDGTEIEFHNTKDLGSDPVIISAEEAGDVPNNYESEVLFYYVSNDVLIDEYDDQIDDPGKLIGDLIESSGFKKNIDRHLYVKNSRLCVVYDIQKVFTKWEGTEGGI